MVGMVMMSVTPVMAAEMGANKFKNTYLRTVMLLLQVCPGAGLEYIGVVPWNVFLKRPLIKKGP